ncbi:hypothetical protein CANTEDRAFT_134571 [Yamadazyma tenuis ATCC 10573]|uniref:Ndc10 domain-containing protein n=1 Tax=Candida tenuis (strain ATCC 10573 / BCRC 21748 / CBS 615 / JCM 9827 / NBRC 10315 / NRRL Y-1498 / VKM Y-70) TaxID=590646 RepID=G3B4P7_CANTC|nr:uncharacterized protein CANTEDRAFT_134571 [Yamadazyma tenuis ATCC 10573]EGV63997.1 hypothetical protein CANTEDRAFT_134571 [Yamadazyma tenuis ATCC 10573]
MRRKTTVSSVSVSNGKSKQALTGVTKPKIKNRLGRPPKLTVGDNDSNGDDAVSDVDSDSDNDSDSDDDSSSGSSSDDDINYAEANEEFVDEEDDVDDDVEDYYDDDDDYDIAFPESTPRYLLKIYAGLFRVSGNPKFENKAINAMMETALSIALPTKPEERKEIDLSDLSFTKGSDIHSPDVLVIQLKSGRNIEGYRHKLPLPCLIGTIARNLWYRLDFPQGPLAKDNFPNFQDGSYRQIKLLYSQRSDSVRPISEQNMMSLAKFSFDQAFGNMSNSRVSFYVNSLQEFPRLEAAGFKPPETYFIARDQVKPPEQLRKKVFPWLESEWQSFEKYQSTLPPPIRDLSLPKLFYMLDQFRDIILQDMVFLVDQNPECVFYYYEVCYCPEFVAYKKDVLAYCGQTEPVTTEVKSRAPENRPRIRSSANHTPTRKPAHKSTAAKKAYQTQLTLQSVFDSRSSVEDSSTKNSLNNQKITKSPVNRGKQATVSHSDKKVVSQSESKTDWLIQNMQEQNQSLRNDILAIKEQTLQQKQEVEDLKKLTQEKLNAIFVLLSKQPEALSSAYKNTQGANIQATPPTPHWGTQVAGQIGQAAGQIGQVAGQIGQVAGQVGQVTNQLPGQVAQLPGQVAQLPGQVAQLPGQVVTQLPGQVSAQVQAQILGQVPGQVSGQISGQVSGQTSAQTSGVSSASYPGYSLSNAQFPASTTYLTYPYGYQSVAAYYPQQSSVQFQTSPGAYTIAQTAAPTTPVSVQPPSTPAQSTSTSASAKLTLAAPVTSTKTKTKAPPVPSPVIGTEAAFQLPPDSLVRFTQWTSEQPHIQPPKRSKAKRPDYVQRLEFNESLEKASHMPKVAKTLVGYVRQWFLGMEGVPSIVSRDQVFKDAWRQQTAAAETYSSRRKIVDFVESLRKDTGTLFYGWGRFQLAKLIDIHFSKNDIPITDLEDIGSKEKRDLIRKLYKLKAVTPHEMYTNFSFDLKSEFKCKET